MESRQRGSEKASKTTKRTHNCEADSNMRMVSVDWDDDVIVTTFGCKRCGKTWEVRKTTAQIDAEMRARL